MKLNISIPLKPIGLNNSYSLSSRGKFATRYKLPTTKVFEQAFEMHLKKYHAQIKGFNGAYDENMHYLVADFRFYIPLFTKTKTISKRSGDWDGLPKISQDCLFNLLDADDSQIISANVTKIHSKNCKIEIDLYLRNISDIM